LAVQACRFKLQISANLWQNFGDDFSDSKGDEQPLARSLGLNRAQLMSELGLRMAEVRAEFERQLG
jgi:hypothetical protein